MNDSMSQSNGSQDIPKLEQPSEVPHSLETEVLQAQVKELEGRLRQLQEESLAGSSLELKLALPTRRDELFEHIVRLQRRIIGLEDDAQGYCTRCEQKVVRGCSNGSIALVDRRLGSHVICSNLKDEDTFVETFVGTPDAPGPVNTGFSELMRGLTTTPNVPLPGASETEVKRPK